MRAVVGVLAQTYSGGKALCNWALKRRCLPVKESQLSDWSLEP